MKRVFWICMMAAAAIFTPATASAEIRLTDTQLVELQAVLQTHIDDNLVGGALLRVSEKDGSLLSYYPTKAHPKIMSTDKFLILCAEFIDNDGGDVMANFYLAQSGGRYVVFETTFGPDPALEHLMKSGRAIMAN